MNSRVWTGRALLACGAGACIVSLCLAQAAPSIINYQGRLTDNGPQQNPLNGLVAMQFAIYDGESGGTLLWSEPPSGTLAVTVIGGIFQVALGNNGNPIDPSVFAGSASRWLEVIVNGETLAPRQRISSVPFALQAERAQSAVSAMGAAVAADAAQLGGTPPSAWQRALTPAACPPGQVLTGIAQGGSASCVTPPTDGHWIVSGNDLISGPSGNVGIGTPSPASKLDVAGSVTSDGVLQVGLGAPVAYDVTTQRYVVEAGPSVNGRVVPLDAALVDALCRDKDGCHVTLAMLNYLGAAQPGLTAARETRLFISETSRWWRLADVDVEGTDGSGIHEYSTWDCYLTDAESWLGSPNSRSDAAVGFGLLNVNGGSYSDAVTICRVVIHD